MQMRFLFSLTASTVILSACSIYQSDGRKFLEKRAYEYAGVEGFREQCQEPAETANLAVIGGDSRAQVFALEASETAPNRMRVVVLGDRPYGCDYGFTNPDEMTSKIPPAIELTVDRLNTGAN
jgi:hypothetical protein